MKRIVCFLILVFCLSMRLCYSQNEKKIVLLNWEDYTDKSLLEDFEKETGIKVILKEFKTPDMMVSLLQSEPENYDVILADDQTVYLLKQYRLLAKIDLNKIPNIKFIKTRFQKLKLDPRNEFSVTGPSYGVTGLVINTNFVPADTDSWAVLWDKKNKGKIALFDDCRDAVSVLLKYSKFSLNSTDPKELKAAEENAKLLKENDVQFGDTFGNIEKVLNGRLWAAQAFSGDVLYKARDHNDIKFVFPKEGYNLFMDEFVISIDSSHQEEAHKFINFMLEPKHAARVANMFFYPSTIEADAFITDDNKDDFKKYFTKEILENGEMMGDVGEAESLYNKIFNFLKLKEE